MRFRGSRARIVYTYGLSQGVVFAASAARITVLISAVGAAGYGLVTAVGAVAPWLLLPFHQRNQHCTDAVQRTARPSGPRGCLANGSGRRDAPFRPHSRRSGCLAGYAGPVAQRAGYPRCLYGTGATGPGPDRDSRRHVCARRRVPGPPPSPRSGRCYIDVSRDCSRRLARGHRRIARATSALHELCLGLDVRSMRTVLDCPRNISVACRSVELGP